MSLPERRGNRFSSNGALPIDPFLQLLPWAIAGAMLIYFLFDTFFTVAPHEQAVVLRFGKYQSTLMPGLHFKLPLADKVLKVSVEEHSLRLPVGTIETGHPAGDEDETLMLTGDLNTASVEWTVQWK